MMSNQCKNQGYVLDAFPTTYKQAEDLFEGKKDMLPPHASLQRFAKYSYPWELFHIWSYLENSYLI